MIIIMQPREWHELSFRRRRANWKERDTKVRQYNQTQKLNSGMYGNSLVVLYCVPFLRLLLKLSSCHSLGCIIIIIPIYVGFSIYTSSSNLVVTSLR